MSDVAASIQDAALKLPDTERLELADLLYDSLPADIDRSNHDDFVAELERRRQELRADPATGIRWSELKSLMQQ